MTLIIEPLTLRPEQLRELAQRLPGRYPVLFDSASPGPLGAWTVLPVASGPALLLERDKGLSGRDAPVPLQHGFLATLDAWWSAERSVTALQPIPGPWRPGWSVWLGYEIAREIEPSLRLPACPLAIEAFAVRTPAALLYEHGTGRSWGIAEAAHQVLLDSARSDLNTSPIAAPATRRGPAIAPGSMQEAAPQKFLNAVEQAREAIAAGEVYQANLSREWTAELAEEFSGADLYERLRSANPAPFAARAQFAGLELLSSSPERLLQIADGVINTRPIAGTRPRSGNATQESGEIAGLLANAKERAEHVMLIDLERNDLGRVCIAGSVEVSEYMAVESYAHVHHIVSNVRGRLRADVTPVDALRAVFPGGTITGCPKIRCMALIGALEGEGRGAYTGSLGWLGTDGSADFNILIRTLTLQGQKISFRAGAGIVADSVPERELKETRAKALGLIRALESGG